MKTVKQCISFLSILLFCNSVSGQNPQIEISFTASHYNQAILIDSVFIENLTAGGDTMLYGAEPVLVLENITGIENPVNKIQSEFNLTHAFPNPFSGKTIFNLIMPENGNIHIYANTISGNINLLYSGYLTAGINTFEFKGGKENLYLISASLNNTTKSIRLINSKLQSTKCRLTFIDNEHPKTAYKASENVTDFIFSMGDELRFTGYSITPEQVVGSDVIIDLPEANSNINFNIIQGIPCPGTPMLIYEDQEYLTVLIGNQCWMKENLNVGEFIPIDTTPTNNNIIEKYCWNNFPDSCDSWGGLYTWHEVMEYSTIPGVQGICPAGWHIPTDGDFEILAGFLGGSQVAGGKVKETGLVRWSNPNTDATNESGFTAIGAGYWGYFNNKSFSALREGGSHWTSTTTVVSTDAWGWAARYDQPWFSKYYYIKYFAISVRCLKD